jgi:O-antigen/teichoic acid export membrane protein
MSSFSRNLLATYASQIYVALAGIVVVPVYIRYMGSEAYGLVGFYAMLQAWFQLLDLGLSPTMSRQTARLSGGALDALTLRRMLRVLEGIFVAVALLGAGALALGADWVATRWLQAQALPADQVRLAIELMAGIIGLRWVAGLYRSAIGGFEQQAWLGGLNAGAATARFVVVLLIFEWVGTTPAHFFGWQLVVAAVETVLLAHKTYRLLPPRAPCEPAVGWHWQSLRGVLGFSLSIAFTSAVWVAVTQTDKLVLSKLLPLAEYGHFTLAVLAASGVTIVSGPLSSALLPRLARLQAQGDEAGLILLYRQATQGMAVIALPVAAVLGFGAERLLQAWTGDAVLAAQAGPILRLYALGNGVLALSAFAYYLQFAKGDVRLHLIGNVLFVLVLIPSIIAAAMRFGGEGAGWAWLLSNLAYLLLWVPLVHRRFVPGLHGRWMGIDLLPVSSVSVIVAAMSVNFLPWGSGRTSLLLELLGIGLFVLIASILVAVQMRRLFFARFRRIFRISISS